MCGICGIVQGDISVEKQQISTMLSFLYERGPDSQNIYLNDNIGIGHSRLSIIDLDERSNQPFVSHEKNVISFNGEIYNFQSIKDELIKEGVFFKTTSDTEVIIQAYQIWGIEKTLEKIDGMFAFCIFNPVEKEIILARDRFGKKPLYYFNSNTSFFFSSDIRSIWSLNRKHLSIDWESIDYYFSELSVPQPKTIWKEIKQIQPAHYGKFNLDSHRFVTQQYWKLPSSNPIEASKEEIVNHTEILLQKAINKRLISDVPLGYFLSGGIDSGLIVALAAKSQSKPIKTFTVSVDNAIMNESKDAERVAKRFNTDHNNIHITADLIQNITSLIKYTGEPFADSSLIPTYLITKAIKEQVTVAISGDGGDELFGGYDDYGLAYRTDVYKSTWGNSIFKTPALLADKLLSRIINKENLGSYDHYSKKEGGSRLFRQMGFPDTSKKELFKQKELIGSLGFTNRYWDAIWKSNKKISLTDNLMRSSLETRLLNDYLVKIDRGSMINSVEVRSPFLDRELAEFSFSINVMNKFTDFENKHLLRELANKHLGKQSSAKQKSGFGIPIHDWLRNDLKPWRDELLNLFTKRNILHEKGVNSIINEFNKGKNEHTLKIWSIICLEIWFQNFYD